MRFKSGALAAVLLLLGLSQASAQTRIVTGKVADSLTSELVTSGQVSVLARRSAARSRTTED